MKKVEIYFGEDSEDRELEVLECKGHRRDVIVILDNKVYHPTFITPLRLSNDLKNFFSGDAHDKYTYEINTIIMENLDRESIIRTILTLIRKKYFFSYATQYNLKMLNDDFFDEGIDEIYQVYPKRKICSKQNIINYLKQ